MKMPSVVGALFLLSLFAGTNSTYANEECSSTGGDERVTFKEPETDMRLPSAPWVNLVYHCSNSKENFVLTDGDFRVEGKQGTTTLFARLRTNGGMTSGAWEPKAKEGLFSITFQVLGSDMKTVGGELTYSLRSKCHQIIDGPLEQYDFPYSLAQVKGVLVRTPFVDVEACP